MRLRYKNEDPVYATPGALNNAAAPRITAGANDFGAYGSSYSQPWSPGIKLIELKSSQIEDSLAPSKVTKPVTHIVTSFRRENISEITEYVDGNGNPSVTGDKYTATGPYAYNWSWGWTAGTTEPISSNPYALVSYEKSVNELASQAKHQFNDENETDNLLNAVESGQLVSGASGVFQLLSDLKSAMKGKPKGKLINGLRDGYLFYSFGIAPLISDIRKINRAVKTFKKDLDQAVKQNGEIETRTAKCGGTVIVNPGYSHDGYSADGSGGWWHYSIEDAAVTQIVGIKGRRTTKYNTPAFKKLDYLISRFVATGPASFVWERIPFSFVVDWFVDLSGIIDAADDALTGSSKDIQDLWFSRKEHYKVACKHRIAYPGSWVSSAEGEVFARHEISYYHREHLQPTILPVASGRFGKKQGSQLAALLHQYVAKLRR